MAPKPNNPYNDFSSLAKNYRNQLTIVCAREEPVDFIENTESYEQQEGEGNPVIIKKSTKTILNPKLPPTFAYQVKIDAPEYFQAYALKKAIQAFEQPIGGIGADASSSLAYKATNDKEEPTIITFPEILTKNETILGHLGNMFAELADSKLYADKYNPDEIAGLFSEKIGPTVTPGMLSKSPSTFVGIVPLLGPVPFNVPEERRGQVADYFKKTFKDAALSLTFPQPKTNASSQQLYAALISFPKVNYGSVLETLSGLKKGELSPQAIMAQPAP